MTDKKCLFEHFFSEEQIRVVTVGLQRGIEFEMEAGVEVA